MEIQVYRSKENYLQIPDEKLPDLQIKFPVLSKAANTETIGKLCMPERDSFIVTLLGELFQELGQDAKDLTTLAYQVNRELFESPFLTTGEFRYLCKQGLRGEYPEENKQVTINLIRILGWIKSYKSSLEKIEFNKELQKAKEVVKEPTPQEFRLNFIARLKELFEIFNQGGNISANEAAFYFEKLWAEKVIKFDVARRDELKKQALANILMANDTANAKSLEEKRKLIKILADVLNEGDQNKRVVSEAMNLGLLTWFDDLKELGLSIDEALDENE